jgi:uncharacterized protein (TIGR02466 family)
MSVSDQFPDDLSEAAAPLRIPTGSLFPTPVYTCRLNDPEVLNLRLRDVILARERIDSGCVNSNVGGWHSGLDFESWGGAAARAVLDAARKIANQVTRDRRGRALRPDWRTECWANVNRHGHANKRHSHPGCFWSGTYYVDTGHGDDRGTSRDGAFEFHDPRVGALLQNAAARLAAPSDGNALIHPEPGLFLLFPSWMPHSVHSYRGAGIRISIAFNLALPQGGKS